MADDATTALIAQMLAADYAAEAGGAGGFDFGDDDSDDWTEKKKKKKRRPKKRQQPVKSKPKPQAKKAKQAAAGSAKSEANAAASPPSATSSPSSSSTPSSTSSSSSATSSSASPRSLNQAQGSGKPKRVIRRWTEEEETLFLEALELHGRDWQACVDHLKGSRSVNNFKSHAQKHFIRLYRDGQPMPKKVCESGEGFTLSGKALDPHSAAARSYGALRPPTNGQPLSEEQLLNRARNDSLLAEQQKAGEVSRQKVVVVSPSEQAEIDKQMAEAKEAKAAAKQAAKDAKAASRAAAALKKTQQRELAAAKRLQKKLEKQAANEAVLYGEDGRTEYSRRRGRRAAASRFQRGMEDSFSFVECQCYHGGTKLAGSGVIGAQPFRVSISANAAAIADLHAHMTQREVIGYLAGSFDVKTRRIAIRAAYPGRSISNDSNAFQEAEMDPVYEVELRARIEKDGHKIVGWYHSHPTFKPVPSAVDVNNQRNYQRLFQHNVRQSSPFVGLIVSPYNLVLPTARSEFQWFYIEGTSANPLSMTVQAEHEGLAAPSAFDEKDLKERAGQLLSLYASTYLPIRVGFSDVWRDLGPNRACTNIDKIRGSLRLRFEEAIQRASQKEGSSAGGDSAAGSENVTGRSESNATAKETMAKVEHFLKWLREQCVADVDIVPSPAASPAKPAQ